jgi:hypothetical protein
MGVVEADPLWHELVYIYLNSLSKKHSSKFIQIRTFFFELVGVVVLNSFFFDVSPARAKSSRLNISISSIL